MWSRGRHPIPSTSLGSKEKSELICNILACLAAVPRTKFLSCLTQKSHRIDDEGVQSMPPPNIPLWHMNYFELKAIENQQTQEKLFTSPLPA